MPSEEEYKKANVSGGVKSFLCPMALGLKSGQEPVPDSVGTVSEEDGPAPAVPIFDKKKSITIFIEYLF